MHNALLTAQDARSLYFRYDADPFDLRPVVKAIMDAENMILDRIPPDQKLVILMGEDHSCQTHTLLLQALLQAHKQAAHPTALGLEGSHNIDWLNEPLPPDDSETTSGAALLRFCKTQKVDVRFNDLARGEKLSPDGTTFQQTAILDRGDEMTENIIFRHASLSYDDLPIHCESLLGIALRNIGIVENAISHNKKSDARIYVQHCGRGHVFGSRSDGHPYKASLTSLFHRHGFAVLAVCSYDDDFIDNGPDDWPHDALKDVSDVIVPANMADGHIEDFKYDIVRQRVNAASGYDL